MSAKVDHDNKTEVSKKASLQGRRELKWNQDVKQHPAQRSVRLTHLLVDRELRYMSRRMRTRKDTEIIKHQKKEE